MIKVTLKNTDGLVTFVDCERDEDDNIVLTGETLPEVFDKVNAMNYMGKGNTREEALENMIKRYESLSEISLILPGPENFEARLKDFFKALDLRGWLKIEGAV